MMEETSGRTLSALGRAILAAALIAFVLGVAVWAVITAPQMAI